MLANIQELEMSCFPRPIPNFSQIKTDFISKETVHFQATNNVIILYAFARKSATASQL